MLLHRNLVANIEQSADWFGPRPAAEEPTVMITALPLYHIFALTACFWFQMLVGGACLLIANPARHRRLRQDPAQAAASTFSPA